MAALVAAAVIVANAHAIERAVGEVVMVLAITAASMAGLALLTVAAVVTIRLRRARSRRALASVNEPREIPAPSIRVLPPVYGSTSVQGRRAARIRDGRTGR